MTAQEKLLTRVKKRQFVCIGLDTDLHKIPTFLQSTRNPILEFNKKIIDKTSDFAASYKFNLAFYERFGAQGLDILKESLQLIPKDILTIGDGKRGDIGNTSEKYAQMFYEEFNFDAVTLNPLMGNDSLEPFLSYPAKLNFILSLTSNPGSNDFEKLKLSDNTFLYQKIISTVRLWNINHNCGLVFGATNREELIRDINLFDGLPILLPGVGAQGASFEDVVKIFKENKHEQFLVNVSRGIIYKSSEIDFSEKAREELLRLNKIADKIFGE